MSKYNFSTFADRVQRLIRGEIVQVMANGNTKNEAAVLVAQVAISSAVGFTAAAMGKRPPTREEVGELTNKIIGLVAELPGEEWAKVNRG